MKFLNRFFPSENLFSLQSFSRILAYVSYLFGSLSNDFLLLAVFLFTIFSKNSSPECLSSPCLSTQSTPPLLSPGYRGMWVCEIFDRKIGKTKQKGNLGKVKRNPPFGKHPRPDQTDERKSFYFVRELNSLALLTPIFF